MSDTILCGVLRLPEMYLDDPITLRQFIGAAREAADELERRRYRIDSLESALARMRKAKKEAGEEP